MSHLHVVGLIISSALDLPFPPKPGLQARLSLTATRARGSGSSLGNPRASIGRIDKPNPHPASCRRSPSRGRHLPPTLIRPHLTPSLQLKLMAATSSSSSSSTTSSTTAAAAPAPPATPTKNLYICIECSYPVQSLYTAYSSADDRSLGRGVRLTQCPRCKRFADKYVEHDFVVLFIDLVLIKPQVYRHLLFNRLGRQDDKFEPSIIRLGILLLLFDVYLTWARIEKEIPPDPFNSFGILTKQPIVVQYMFFLLLCLTESLLFHLTIRLLSRFLLGFTRPNSVSTALLVSSCTKLFPILMVIWEYDVPAAAKSVGWAVVVNNVEALRILLGVDYVRAAGLAGAGAVVRATASQGILAWTGLLGRESKWGSIGLEEWVARLGLGK